MNKNQKGVLVAVALFIVGMLLFPPFRDKRGNNMGYEWLNSPPCADSFRGIDACYSPAIVDIPMLLTQWGGVLIVGVVAFLYFKEK